MTVDGLCILVGWLIGTAAALFVPTKFPHPQFRFSDFGRPGGVIKALENARAGTRWSVVWGLFQVGGILLGILVAKLIGLFSS
jgi:hypothetical protein